MIDVDIKEVIKFDQCGHFMPGAPSRCTVYRWALRGVRGVKLETIFCGHKRFTSREAISRFLAAQNRDEQPAPAITAKQRRTQAEAANRVLEEAGL